MDGVLSLAPSAPTGGPFCVETAITLDEGADLFNTRLRRESPKGIAFVSGMCNLISHLDDWNAINLFYIAVHPLISSVRLRISRFDSNLRKRR